MKTTARLLLCLGLLSGLGPLSVSAQTTPLQVIPTRSLVFPNKLTVTQVTDGWARVVISVNEKGLLTDLLVHSYTHKAFAEEATQALREWKYVAARDHDQPVTVRIALTIDFHDNKGTIKILQVNDIDQTPQFKRDTVVKEIVGSKELDKPVQVVEAVKPLNPAKDLEEAAEKNIVTIDYFIDESGEPRMPVVLESPHDEFSQAALHALLQWRFAPPTRQGRAVAVRAKQQFVFNKNKGA